ncbi:Monooxygenase, DszA protein [Pseudomonas syringae pv. theae]|uniref:Monooxygenase, DszA protein n=5 Tax=Pseudomonas syringae TaxID=317 RepID=A0A3M5N1D3_PSESX|nr:Monooxygenase, DszA protein [Pseudomonas syringae pv. theae]
MAISERLRTANHGRAAGADSPCGHRHRHRPRRLRGRADLRSHPHAAMDRFGCRKSRGRPADAAQFRQARYSSARRRSPAGAGRGISRYRPGRQHCRARRRGLDRSGRSPRHQHGDFSGGWQHAVRTGRQPIDPGRTRPGSPLAQRSRAHAARSGALEVSCHRQLLPERHKPAVAGDDLMARKKILLNAFNMNCIGHINHGLWTHPRDTSTQFNSLNYWTDLAKLLERGLFDGLFIADIVGVYDVYQNSVDVTLKEAIQLPVNDPLLLVSAMAGVTKHLGFGLTANLTYDAPYLFARRMSTLDHLSRGRVGWNIVTGYLDSAARAMGLSEQNEHDRRYDQADEYLEVLYKLWEGSWEDDAVINDREQRVYAQPGKVHKIRHQGEFYQVEGYHLCEPSPQRTPVLFQAGSSERGLQFAGQNAECVFISGQNKAATREQVDKVRASAVQAGRNPDDVKVFMGLNVIVAATEAQAREKHAEYRLHASAEAGVAHFAASTGIDFAEYELNEPIQYMKSNAIQSATKNLKNNDWTRQKLLDQHALGGRYITLTGSPEQVADELESWIEETGLDGFNLTRIVTPESYEDFIDLVIPELQRRGSYKTAYENGSLRKKLFPEGTDRLPQRHAGAAHRHI